MNIIGLLSSIGLKNEQELSPKVRFFLYSLSFLIIYCFMSLYSDNVLIRPIGDELYHVTDMVANGDLTSINPFAEHYQFLGHPPLYRLTLFFWFKVFPVSFVSAHMHAMLFSFLSLYTFFLLLFHNFNWILSVVATLVLLNLPVFIIHMHQCLADIPALFLFLVSLLLLQKKKYKMAAVSILLLIMMRESGIALPIAIIGLGFFKKRFNLDTKRDLAVSLPSILFLGYFFAVSKFIFGHFSNHTYVKQEVPHLAFKVKFFSLDSHKLDALSYIFHVIHENMYPTLEVYLIVSIMFVIYYFNKIKSDFSYILTLFALYALAFLIFFTLYVDVIPRDLFPILAGCIFIIFSALGLFLKNKSALISIIIGLFVIVFSKSNDYTRRAQKEESKLLEISKILQSFSPQKKLCLGWPFLGSSDLVHGYFQEALNYDCEKPDIVLLTSHAGKPGREKQRALAIRNKLVLTYERKIKNDSFWFEIYSSK